MKLLLISSFIVSVCALSGCSSHVTAPKAALEVPECKADRAVGIPHAITVAEDTRAIDMKAENEVVEETMKAWRLAGDGKGKESLAILDKLETKYPNVSTVQMMKGQVLDRLGRKKEAVKFYEESARQSEFSALHLFKYAESLRTTGDAKGAIVQYRKLLQISPRSVDARLGLAQAMHAADPKNREALEFVNDALHIQPDNKEAKRLLKEMSN